MLGCQDHHAAHPESARGRLERETHTHKERARQRTRERENASKRHVLSLLHVIVRGTVYTRSTRNLNPSFSDRCGLNQAFVLTYGTVNPPWRMVQSTTLDVWYSQHPLTYGTVNTPWRMVQSTPLDVWYSQRPLIITLWPPDILRECRLAAWA